MPFQYRSRRMRRRIPSPGAGSARCAWQTPSPGTGGGPSASRIREPLPKAKPSLPSRAFRSSSLPHARVLGAPPARCRPRSRSSSPCSPSACLCRAVQVSRPGISSPDAFRLHLFCQTCVAGYVPDGTGRGRGMLAGPCEEGCAAAAPQATCGL